MAYYDKPALITGVPGVGVGYIGRRLPDSIGPIDDIGHRVGDSWYVERHALIKSGYLNHKYVYGFSNNWLDYLDMFRTIVLLVADRGTLADRVIKYRNEASEARKKAWDFTEITSVGAVDNITELQDKMVIQAIEHGMNIINTGTRELQIYSRQIPGKYVTFPDDSTLEHILLTIRSV